MSKVTVERNLEAARPMLLSVNDIINEFPKTSYVVYYKNYTQQEDDNYKNIDSLHELFLPHKQLEFKIINFEKQSPPFFLKNQSLQIMGSKVVITAIHPEGSITLNATILNKSESDEAVIDVSLVGKRGYDEFYKFRKKYKTMENLTRKLEFQLDHRIKINAGGLEYQFNLQDKKKQHYFLNLANFKQNIQIILEQTTSIEDYIHTDIIDEADIDLHELMDQQFSYVAKLKYSNLFEAQFLFDLIKNQNLSSSDLVSIRVLQTSNPSKVVKIGNQQSLHLNTCIKLQPLLSGKYYDYQWGYLNENLSKIEGNNSIYEHMSRLTTSIPNYPHFINQQIIDLYNCNTLLFDVDGQTIRMPTVYIMKGFNYIESNKVSIKFFVDFSKSAPAGEAIDAKADHRRVYELNLQDIWNLNKLNNLLDRSGCDQFSIKIINQDTSYFIPLERKTVNRSQYRKEAKDLQTKQEITQKQQNKYLSIQNSSKSKDKIIIVQSTGINPFYLIQMTSSSSLSFQVIIDNSIALEGSLHKQKIVDSKGKQIVHLLTSVEDDCSIGLVMTFLEIVQPNDSAATYFNFRQRLTFAQTGETEEITYDIQIEFDKSSKLRNLRSKISPQIKKQTKDGLFLREFTGQSGIFSKQDRLNFTLKIRKMFYNEQLNYFDNELLINKPIAINPSAQLLKQGKHLMVKLQKEFYEGIEIDLYDLNIKKRMKYYLQIYAEKNEFLDYKDSSYKIKIPSVLWNFSNFYRQEPLPTNYQITSHLNRKSKNADKFTFTRNFQQEIVLDHYNYNDGISLTKEGQIAYSKFLRCIKVRCDILKDKIGWTPQSDWYFAVLTFNGQNFYFMVQRLFDPYEEKKNDSDSDGSRKTVSRGKSNRSDKHKIDPLAKTMDNMDMFKLKKKKNDLIAQGRQLTARYVKRQQKILQMTKQLEDLDQQIRKKNQEESQLKTLTKKPKKENQKMKQFYRSICECGDRNPKYNGYCQSCLKKLKQRYEIYVKQYKQKSYQYQKQIFEKYNQKEKIERLKRKLEGQKNHSVPVQVQDNGAAEFLIKDMEEKSLKKSIEDLKLDIFELQQEKQSLIETSNWQMKILQEKISFQDGKIYKNSQELDSHKNRLRELAALVQKAQIKKQSDST